MPNYQYAARDERGNAVSGLLVAPNAEALAEQLKRMGYLVTKSREVDEGATVESVLQRLRRVGYEDLVLFNVQLSTMVRVGIPLVTALDTLSQQTDNPRLRQTIGDVARNVEAGAGFSEALSRHPAVFSPLFINMVRSGEISGKLDEILRRLAIFAKHQADLREQLKTALTYPLILLVVGISVIVFLLLGIIPKFMKIFLEAGVPLPLPTFILYQLSQALRHYGLALAAVIALGAAAAGRYARTARGRRQLDTLLLKLPVIGTLVRKTALARFARTLETLLSSGVPALESLGIAEQTCGNAVIADACQAAQASVRRGGTICEPLRISRQFPPMVVQMLSVGESSGTLDRMLAEVADHYDELVRHHIKRLTALIEPIFLMVIGGLVALIMASVLLPLFRMVNVIR
ncbi:MAG: type II secretion system F family protein [Candidatus Omnitrophica bacterium]|nr:type II secretion system F family protein [Candidatus Omnitrophota bacterium]